MHHRTALVLGQEQLVVGLAGRAVEVHPQDAPVAHRGRGAVVLRLVAVDPEQVARADDVALAVVVQRALAADAQLDQVGGQVLAGGVVLRPAVEVAQLLHVGDGGAHRLGGRHGDPVGLIRQIQIEAQLYTCHETTPFSSAQPSENDKMPRLCNYLPTLVNDKPGFNDLYYYISNYVNMQAHETLDETQGMQRIADF